ncbi:universal stress protein [Larkinella harenae]
MKNATIRRILVPVNYKNMARSVLYLASAMARRHGATLWLLHVVDPDHFAFPSGEGLAVSLPREEILHRETQRLTQWAAEVMTGLTVPYAAKCRIGPVVERISEVSHQVEADLIIMGTPKGSGLFRSLMGPKAYRTLKQAPCPVLTVPESVQSSDFKRILFPVRPVLGVLDKYDLARIIAQKNNAHLTLLGLPHGKEPLKSESVRMAMSLLNQRLDEDAIETNGLVAETDSAVQTLVRQAEELGADLIVSTADLDFWHWVTSPFIKQLISRATVPVLAVRPPTFSGNTSTPSHGRLLPSLPSFRSFYPSYEPLGS